MRRQIQTAPIEKPGSSRSRAFFRRHHRPARDRCDGGSASGLERTLGRLAVALREAATGAGTVVAAAMMAVVTTPAGLAAIATALFARTAACAGTTGKAAAD